MKIVKVDIKKVRPNPENPRVIKNDQFKRLVKSLREFPEMLELREIVVDENMMVLGGNMRLKALQEIGEKEITVKIAEGFTEEQKKEFLIKDNSAFGAWNFDELANNFSDCPLVEWGVEVPQWEEPTKRGKEESEIYTLKFTFEKDEASRVMTLLHQNLTENGEQADDKWRERCLLRLLK